MQSQFIQTTFIFLSLLSVTLFSSMVFAQSNEPILCENKKCTEEESAFVHEDIIVTGTRIPPFGSANEEDGSMALNSDGDESETRKIVLYLTDGNPYPIDHKN